MAVLWQPDPPLHSVREVLDALTGRDLAYTTVLTVLDRLAKKGFVHRVLEGRAWQYSAAVTREQIAAAAVRLVLADPLLDRAVIAAELKDLLEPPAL